MITNNKKNVNDLKVALIHDWLIRFGGAERVLKTLYKMFPEAPIYTFLFDKKMRKYFPKADIRPSFLQKAPEFLKKRHRWLLPILPVAAESFDLSEFDLVISSCSGFIKGIITKPKTTHICYLHSPTRFLWDWHSEYQKENNFPRVLKFPIKLILHYLHIWDRHSSERVDYFIANSKNTADRIWKYYRRRATVIYPPVNLRRLNADQVSVRSATEERSGDKYQRMISDFYLIVSHLAFYKKIDVAVDAFNKLGLPLVVIGDGPQKTKLEKLAKNNISFLGWQSSRIVKKFYQNCEAFIFPGEDDFGITAVEAMSFGKPVLALRKGGVIESVIEGVTGEFFDDAVPEVLADGVRRLRENIPNYNPKLIKKRAEKFSEEKFITEIEHLISKLINDKIRE